MIDDKLPYLSSIDPKYEKYCLKNNSLIISKNSYPYKIAVASVMEGQRILANGNLYIIELDEEKANPYYIKAFFDSEQGHAVLKSITVGATIPNIGVDKLRKVKIPLPPMEEQNRISQKYQAVLDEISVIKLRLEKAINRLYHIFDEECD
jgi:type I restriction enzyme M protein